MGDNLEKPQQGSEDDLLQTLESIKHLLEQNSKRRQADAVPPAPAPLRSKPGGDEDIPVLRDVVLPGQAASPKPAPLTAPVFEDLALSPAGMPGPALDALLTELETDLCRQLEQRLDEAFAQLSTQLKQALRQRILALRQALDER